MNKKLIIFGGSFDPIHKGHLKIALKAFNKIKADKLFFVPCSQNHPTNKSISASNEQRMDMIKLCIKKYPQFEICDYEINNTNETSYTINTIRYIKNNYSNYDLYLLIGYDQLINFTSWKDYKEILEYCKLICHIRKFEKQQDVNVDFKYIKIGYFNIKTSSSDLKVYPNKKYLDSKVIKYINDNGLYAVDRLKLVMSDYRLQHCIDVANIAKNLAISHKLYPLINRAYVAGIYHDYAKDYKKEEQIKIAHHKLKYFDYPSWKVLHANVGAYEIEKKFFVDDYQVLTAIKNHTIPNDFSTLTKLIYIADKIAPRHDNQGDKEVEKWVKMSKQDLDQCFRTIHEYYLDFNKGN